jgi:hypothetical protein
MTIERVAFQKANAALLEDLLITRLEMNVKESSSQLHADKKIGMQVDGENSHTTVIKEFISKWLINHFQKEWENGVLLISEKTRMALFITLRALILWNGLLCKEEMT